MGDAPPPSSSPLRIAILECDTPIGHTREKYSTYGNLFSHLLHNSLRELPSSTRPELDITKFDVVNQEVYPPLENIDAVLLTGSKWNSFDDDPWILKLVEFTKKALHDGRVRVVGVCFGHQIIGRALGVRVDRSDRGWETSVTAVTLTERGREVLGLDGEEMQIHQMHRDVVYTCPEGVERLGFTERCDVQGMYERGRLISVQGHPEFDGDIVGELLENRHERGIFDDGMFEDGMNRVRRPHDGVKVGAAFLRFLLDGRG